MIKKLSKNKVKNKPKNNTLKRWLYTEQLKFIILSFILIKVSNFITWGMNSLFKTPTIYPSLFFGIIFITFSISMLVKWLPKDNMDRKSYISLSNTRTIVYLPAILLLVLIISTTAIINQNINIKFILIQLSIIIALYILGLLITGIYSIYKRGISMGISKLKMILSIPFGTELYFYPGYLLEFDTKEKQSINIKSNWIKNLTNWTIKNPRNLIIIALINNFIIVFILFNPMPLILNILFWFIFISWISITGKDKFKYNIGGAYTTYAIIFNIIFPICIIVFLFVSLSNFAY